MKELFPFMKPTGTDFYNVSGKYSTPLLVVAIFLTLTIAITLGLIYNAFLLIIPFVYLNFLMPIGLVFIGGYIIKLISRVTLIRSYKVRGYLAIGYAIAAYYIQWFAYVVFYSTEDIVFFANLTEYAGILFKPGAMISSIRDINSIGPWSIFGIHFNGFILALIWFIEALIILIVPSLIANNTPILPFSESFLKWYPKLTLQHNFGYVSAKEKLKEQLGNSLNDAISFLGKGDAFRYSKLSVFYLKDEDVQYLYIENVFLENKGRGAKNVKPSLLFYKITTTDANELLDKYGKKREHFIF